MIDVVLIAFGAIAFAIGATLYAIQFRQGLRAHGSRKWPSASAVVTASTLEHSPDSKRRFRAAVQYRYRVGEKEYQSDRVFWGGSEGGEKSMASVVDRYPAGRKVKVFYHPQNPAEAVIDPVQNSGSRPLVLYATAMMALGLFALTGGAYALLH